MTDFRDVVYYVMGGLTVILGHGLYRLLVAVL